MVESAKIDINLEKSDIISVRIEKRVRALVEGLNRTTLTNSRNSKLLKTLMEMLSERLHYVCPFCKREINISKLNSEFCDQSSIKEFELSGLCQKCQDKFFSDFPSITDNISEFYVALTRSSDTIFFF